MEKREMFGTKDFFSKDFSFGKAHSSTCDCTVCLQSDELFDKLSLVADGITSEKVTSLESKKICDLLDSELLETLCCGNGVEFEQLLENYQQIWNKEIDGKQANSLDDIHEESCKCIVCSVKKEITSKLDDLCSSKSLDDSDFLEIVEERSLQTSQIKPYEEKPQSPSCESKDASKRGVQTYLICEPHQPLILTTDNGVVDSLHYANSLEEFLSVKIPAEDARNSNNDVKSENVIKKKLEDLDLKEIEANEMIDICLCEPGKLSPYCFKHSIAYCQHMQTKLYEEGCTCTRESECLFCQRLKCNYCSHERTLPSTCPSVNDPQADDLTLKISSWLDDKLLEVGVSPDVIKQFSEPIDYLKTGNQDEGMSDKAKVDLPQLLADHLERNTKEKQVWDSKPILTDLVITDKMKDDILNMNQLFDVRPFPRCYKLKGVKNSEGGYSGIKEEYMDLGFEAWKLPTQFPEDTLPLAAPLPEVEIRLEKEEEIRKRARNNKSSSIQKKVKIIGLSDDWRPIVETSIVSSDYTESYSFEEKQAWAQKTYDEIMEKSEGPGESGEVNLVWSMAQPLLDKYGEEICPSTSTDEQQLPNIDLEQILQQGSEFCQQITERFRNSKTIGYKPEFWEGLEKWQPPKNENAVRKRLIDEVKKFSKELDSFNNDFERALTGRPGIEINAEETLSKLIESLPPELNSKIEQLKSDLPEDWISDPESVLLELANSSIQRKSLFTHCDVQIDSSNNEKTRAERTISECDSVVFSEEDDVDAYGVKTEAFFYDDEEKADEIKKEIEYGATPEDLLKKDMPSLSKQADAILDDEQPTNKNSTSANYNHQAIPYVIKLKEDMLKNSPNGLHPTQKLWYDRPMFPYWTPSVIYDLSEIDKLFFDGTPEYSPNTNEAKLKEIKDRLLNRESSNLEDSEENVEDSTQAAVSLEKDEPDACVVMKQPHIEEEAKQQVKESKKTKLEKKSKRSALKSISDDDCLIKEDDFKAAIEQLLEAEATKKDYAQAEEEGSRGGALSLDQIHKGIAGQVKSVREGAIQLDSNIDFDLESIVPCPALKYRFKLDIFQKQAIIALEAGLSVFVAAHTSAGKTVAAEYAIAMALRTGCRVVYTSPIKALSNQKYNDFTKKFKGQMKVGIITGDVQLNKEAECLIMTTEILRSMLYNQSSILSDLEYVVFDEVHYFNDPERGNVWEEVLILLPHQCQLVMLSATVPNVMNFASWVGTLRKREVIVTTTTRRPVPLKHYIHYSTEPEHVSLVVPVRNAEGPFLAENFQKAITMKSKIGKPKFNSFRVIQANDWTRFIIYHLQRHQRLPAVVFCFSRKRCDELASDVLRKVDLVEDEKKKRHIENFFNRQINMLQPEDRDIQQIVTMKGLLMKGIGVHHSGILPILKEIVEVLFSESQIKLLFATETFAMGVNMPAKTVVFQQTSKYDGVEGRCLKPGEYTQMAGRAGRRGLDKSGTVIITEWNTRPQNFVTQDQLCTMLTGSVDPLESQFRLRYSMILTALKPEGENSIHAIIQKSFFDFSLKARKNKTQESTDKVYIELKKITEDMKMIPPNLRDVLCDYCDITYQFFSHHESIREKMFEHKQFKTFLNVGRMVSVSYQRYVSVFGVILHVDPVLKTYDVAVMKSSQCHMRSLKEKYPEATEEDVISWYRLVGFRKMELLPFNCVGRMDPQDSLELIQCKASNILRFIRLPVYKMNKGVAPSIIDILKSPRRIYSQHVDNLSRFLMDVVMNVHNLVFLKEDDINFNHPLLEEDVIKYHKLNRAFDENLFRISLPPAVNYPLLDYLEKCYWFLEKQRAIDKRKVQAQKEELTSLFDDFDSKLEFLKKNKYIKEDDDIVDTKGRIASRMTNFEVFVTEILLTNVLEDLEGPETAALLSCLVIPGVSTEPDNGTENPLFKPIIDTNTEDLNEICNPGRGAPTRMKGREIKKTMNTMQKELTVKREEIESTNALIEKYLQLPIALDDALDKVNHIRLHLIQQEETLNIEAMEGSDLKKVTFFLAPVVYAWAKGRPIREIMQVLAPNIQEGILVRWIINLNETIKDIDSAIHHFLKDSRIKEKLESASNCIKRGIIDTPSLYLNQRT